MARMGGRRRDEQIVKGKKTIANRRMAQHVTHNRRRKGTRSKIFPDIPTVGRGRSPKGKKREYSKMKLVKPIKMKHASEEKKKRLGFGG